MNEFLGNKKQDAGRFHDQPKNSVLTELEQLLNDQGATFGNIKPEKLVKLAKEFNEGRNYEFKSTQFRKFYDAVRGIWDHPKVRKLQDNEKISDDFSARLIFLRPHIIKASKEGKLNQFGEIMDFGLQKIKTKKDLYNFVKFFESIIAYAKK